MNDHRELLSALSAGAEKINVVLSATAGARLLDYIELIAKWNKVHNLTAVREPEEMVTLHLIDSLTIVAHIAQGARVIDVGSGAGLPGIPLAIAREDLHVSLLDSNHKKAAFLRQAKGELHLENVEVIADRVENAGKQMSAEKLFDVVVSRAFSDLPDFVVAARHLLAPNGRMLAMKGVYPYEEIAKLPATMLLDKVVPLTLPGADAQRHLVLLKAA
jgi:16S rRNA (guanine527-N7)-methyltransferase